MIALACEFLEGPWDGDVKDVAEGVEEIMVHLGWYQCTVAGVTFVGAVPVRPQGALYRRASLTSFHFDDYVWGAVRLAESPEPPPSAPPPW